MTATLEQDARAIFDEFARAWNAHDASAMAALWIEEGTVIDLWGHIAHGRSAIEEFLAGEHREPMRDSSYRIIATVAEARSAEVAIVECTAVIEGVRNPKGRSYSLPHRVVGVMRCDEGMWRFLSLHPTLSSAAAGHA